MNMMSIWKSTLAVAALLTILLPLPSEAGPMGKAGPGPAAKGSPPIQQKCSKRFLSDFLSAQGSTSTFFKPVKDYVGWTDAGFTTFGLVDYAGLANQYIKTTTGHSLGTEVKGYVLECPLASGAAQITVALFTTNALGFAQSIEALAENEFDFVKTPTIFGAKAQDVVNGAKPAVGPATLFTTFSISEPGAPLPDFLDVVDNPKNYAPVWFSFASTTFGKCPGMNRLARLDIHENAFTDATGTLIYKTEKVEIHDSRGGNCQ
jgi:hypothetical protein